MALLAHEATHVAALIDPGSAWRRATGQDAEEARPGRGSGICSAAARAPVPSAARSAAGVARPPAGARRRRPPPPSGHAVPTAGPGSVVPGQFRAPPPRRRPWPPSRPRGCARTSTGTWLPPAAAPDLEALRRSLIAEVMQRVRSEIERGA